MRLTEKDYCGYDIKERKNFNGYKEQEDYEKLFSALQKLGQLEDIEEELGVDLITLFKALKNGIYDKNGQFYFPTLGDEFDDNINDTIFYLIEDTGMNKSYSVFLFKDYGKTWALTKEELL